MSETAKFAELTILSLENPVYIVFQKHRHIAYSEVKSVLKDYCGIKLYYLFVNQVAMYGSR